MRRATLISSCGVLTLICGLISACTEPGLSTGMNGSPQGEAPLQSTDTTDTADPTTDLAAQAAAQAERIAEISARTAPAQQPQEIIWRDMPTGPPIEPVQSHTVTDQPDHAAVTLAMNTPEPTPQPAQDTDEVPAGRPQPDATAHVRSSLSQVQAYNQHLKAIKHSDDSNLSKAINAATLGAAGPHRELDWSLLTPLSPKDQERVQRYYKAVAAMRDQALTGDGQINQAAIAGKLDEVFGNQPVSIRSIELCEKVLGYGVYDTFPDRIFPAGRDQKMIVYVELDHFMPSLRSEGDGYEVRLRQELELYESNGFEVWSHEPVQIVDVSKNQRRDFFVVQLVTLPGKLALGQYHLKVRIYDENAGTRDEISLPIQIVADSTLVKKSGR